QTKDKYPDNLQTNVVYTLGCAECPSSYVGKTERHLGTRVNEHKAACTNDKIEDSALANHHVKTNHTIAWKDVKIVASDRNPKVLRVKEAVQIAQQTHPLNRDVGVVIPKVYKNLIGAIPKLGSKFT